jgi:hypothetical protein
MITATELVRAENERMEKAIRYEKLTGLVTSGTLEVTNLKTRIKKHDAAIAKATAVETAAAVLDPDVPGVGGRDCRTSILESTALYRMFHTQQRKFAADDLKKAAADLERYEKELQEFRE